MTHYTKGTPSGLEAPPTACRRPVSGTVSLPSSGCFSPFPHGTGSLSVSKEYLAFEGGPPIFRQDFTCPALLDTSFTLPVRGCHPLWPTFPGRSGHAYGSAGPRSLATTGGVSVDFLSSGYLDVSVPRVCSLKPMYSASKYLVQRPDVCMRRQQDAVRWVAPFGDPRIKAYSRLPAAYRRVSRPSSPLAAKASTKRPSRA